MFYELDHPMISNYFFFSHGSDFNFTAHIHYCYELIFVTSGEMIVTVNDVEYSVKKGEAVMVFPNQIHSMRTDTNSRHNLFVFAPNLISSYTKMIDEKVPKCNKFSISQLCYDIHEKIPSELLEIKGFLYTACHEFHKTAEYVDVDKTENPLLYRIFRFIQKNYGGNCTLEDLSQYTGYDYSYLSRYFRKIVCLSFNDYVNKVRVSHACYLLTNTDMNMLEISVECGFKSLRSLNRNFKDQVGITPSEYRREKSVTDEAILRVGMDWHDE